MKKVTKILLVVALATFSFQSFAQTFGVQAGLNMANIGGKDGGESIENNKMLMGFNAGVTAEFEVNESFSIETGLILNTKGTKYEYSEDDGFGVMTDYTTKMNVMSLDIPFNAKYAFDLGGNKLFLAAGPYVGIAISGKNKTEISALGETIDVSTDIEFGNDAEEDQLKRLDFGINIGAGLEFGAIGVGVQYGLGLANLVPEGDSDNKINTRTLGISVSYKFGK